MSTGRRPVIPRPALLEGAEALVARLAEDAARRRHETFLLDPSTPETLAASQQPHRQRLHSLLGWPLNLPPAPPDTPAKIEQIGENTLATIHRLQFRNAAGLLHSGALLLTRHAQPRPLVFLLHSGQSTPEQVIRDETRHHGLHRRLLEKGHSLYLPQLLAWPQQDTLPAFDRLRFDARLRRFGSSLAAQEISGLDHALHHLAQAGHAPGSTAALAGLAYGGLIALLAAAALPRFTALAASASLTILHRAALPEMAFAGMDYLLSETEIAALLCPRPLYIEMPARAPRLDPARAQTIAQTLLHLYTQAGAPANFQFHLHPPDAPTGLDPLGHLATFLSALPSA